MKMKGRAKRWLNIDILIMYMHLKVTPESLKDKSKVGGDFFTRFPLKFFENNGVGEIVI